MSYEQTYTFIDDKWHAVGWGEHTQCGLVIPFGNGYVTDVPKKAHCGPDTKLSEQEADNPDPVASKAAADEQAAKVVGEPVETVTGEAAVAAPAKAATPATKTKSK